MTEGSSTRSVGNPGISRWNHPWLRLHHQTLLALAVTFLLAHALAHWSQAQLWLGRTSIAPASLIGTFLGLLAFYMVWELRRVRARRAVNAGRTSRPRRSSLLAFLFLAAATTFLVQFMVLRSTTVLPFEPSDWWIKENLADGPEGLPDFIAMPEEAPFRGWFLTPLSFDEENSSFLDVLAAQNSGTDPVAQLLREDPNRLIMWIQESSRGQLQQTRLLFFALYLAQVTSFAAMLGSFFSLADPARRRLAVVHSRPPGTVSGQLQSHQAPAGSTPPGTGSDYQVFLSFKNLLADGQPSPDSVLAREIYEHLTRSGYQVFLSNVSLERLGTSAYKKAIDDALDTAKILVAVGTSADHMEAHWVRYEWDSFFNDILSGVKPGGRVFAYVEGVPILELPRSLRQAQTFFHADGSLAALTNFIANALEKDQSAPLSQDQGVYCVSSKKDRAYADALSAELKQLGISWCGNHTASDLPEAARRIADSSFVVFLDSSNALGADLYQLLDLARSMGKPIIPLRLEAVAPRSDDDPLCFLETIQFLDATRLSMAAMAEELAALGDQVPL